MSNPLDSTIGSGGGLTVTTESADYLKETGGWAKFLAILGFVFVGLLVIIAFFVGAVMSTMGMGSQLAGMEFLLTIIYLAIAAVYFFPILFLFQFASKVGVAVRENDTAKLTSAFSSLKSHYKFIGILTAIGVGLYVIIIIFAVIGGMMV